MRLLVYNDCFLKTGYISSISLFYLQDINTWGQLYVDEIGILDYAFQDTVTCSTHNMWSTVIKKKEGQTRTN